jgi:hypothetical protein
MIHGLEFVGTTGMGNHRLTLTRPPFALSPQSSKSYRHDQPDQFWDEDWVHFLRDSHIRFQGPAAEANRSDVELLEMDLVDWMNADHFPPLNSSQKNPIAAFGFPKHS